MRTANAEKVCRYCRGKRFIRVKAADGRKECLQCPHCGGTGRGFNNTK